MIMTELDIQSNGSDLVIQNDQSFWTEKQLAALHQLGVGRAHNGDLAVFFHQAQRTGLDPFARQIYMIERQGKQTIQTGIDGFRLIARRAVDRAREGLGYGDTLWCGEDGVWRDVWLSKQAPAAAKVTVLRNGQPFPAIALFTEYAATKTNGELTKMWVTKPALMLAKCAEALALRKAFPQDLSGIYTSDEMGQAGNGYAAPAEPEGRPLSIQDAVESHKATSTAPADAAAMSQGEELPEPLRTREQASKLAIVMREAGLDKDRDEAMAYFESVIGRRPESSKDLTVSECSAIIEALSQPAEDHANPVTGEVVDAEVVEDWPQTPVVPA